MLSFICDIFGGKNKKKETQGYKDVCSLSKEVHIQRAIVDTSHFYGEQYTHHIFGGYTPSRIRVLPVMFYTKHIKPNEEDKCTSFQINFKDLDVLGVPLININNVYIEHESEIVGDVYWDASCISHILLNTEKHENVFITKIPIDSFPRCFHTDTRRSIKVEFNTKERKARKQLIVEYVQAAKHEDSLLQVSLNRQNIQCMPRVIVQQFEQVSSATYKAVIKADINHDSFLTGCVIAVPAHTKLAGIKIYLNDTTSQDEIYLHDISPALAAEKFRENPLSVIEKHGYIGYKVPFSVDKTTSNEVGCIIPNGAINLKTVATNNQELVVEITNHKSTNKLPYVCSTIISKTPLYI